MKITNYNGFMKLFENKDNNDKYTNKNIKRDYGLIHFNYNVIENNKVIILTLLGQEECVRNFALYI